MTTAAKIYAEINRDFANQPESFIANVLLPCSKPTTRLRNLLAHIRDGKQFSCLSFQMPYNGFFVDGVAVNLSFLDKRGAKVEDHRIRND
jgi:hypothetical protein